MKTVFSFKGILFLAIILSFSSACAPVRFVAPLEKGESAVGFNAGGPLIHFAGTVIPVPFSSVYYGYGISEKGTVSVGMHITSLIYKNLHADLAYTHEIVNQENFIPGISLTPGAHFILGLRETEFRFYPTLDLNVFYEYSNDRHMTYLNLNNWIDPHPGKIVEDSKYTIWRPTMSFGHMIRLKKWEVGLEYKYLGFTLDNTRTVVDYVNNTEIGAHGIYLQFFKKL